MRRTVIGTLFGQPGFYVSQPGDDLDNPTKNLLLDSRFSSLEIAYSGLHPLTRSGPTNGAYWFNGTLSFPSLGYVPLAYVGFVDLGSDVVSYPPNVSDINGRFATDPRMIVRHNEIFVSYYIQGGQGAFNANFSYVIFRDPA